MKKIIIILALFLTAFIAVSQDTIVEYDTVSTYELRIQRFHHDYYYVSYESPIYVHYYYYSPNWYYGWDYNPYYCYSYYPYYYSYYYGYNYYPYYYGYNYHYFCNDYYYSHHDGYYGGHHGNHHDGHHGDNDKPAYEDDVYYGDVASPMINQVSSFGTNPDNSHTPHGQYIEQANIEYENEEPTNGGLFYTDIYSNDIFGDDRYVNKGNNRELLHKIIPYRL